MQPRAFGDDAGVLMPNCATRQHARESASERAVHRRFGMSGLSSDAEISCKWRSSSR